MVLNPTTDHPLTDQYIKRAFERGPAHSTRKAAAAEHAYLTWRESKPDGNLFFLSNYAGRLVGTHWLEPRYKTDERLEMTVPTMAIGRANLYQEDAQLGAEFLSLTHAHAYLRIPYAGQGIMMENVKSLALMSACAAIGYKAASEDCENIGPNSGIRGADMVVSSGPLDDLIRRDVVDIQLPPAPEPPSLRLIQGNKGD